MSKVIVIGVTSSIAAYKSVDLVSRLLKKGYDVEVVMSKNATQFVSPLTFSSLTKHKTYVDTFDREVDYTIEHIALAKRADLFVIAPASANVIAKVAHGICDDMLTTTFLATTAKKLIAPAMNTNMYLNDITQDNIKKCQTYGMHIIEPAYGMLACAEEGIGKLAPLDEIIEHIEMALHHPVLKGKTVLVSAGPTREKMDPVRFISNYSTGKMGYAIARAARNLGARVILVSGPVDIARPLLVEVIQVESAKEMEVEMKAYFDEADYVFMSGAVGDYACRDISSEKLKKQEEDILHLVKTNDILKDLGKLKTNQKLCGFAMETQNVLENGRRKLVEKNCDMLVVNDLFEKGAGFAHDTNKVTFLYPNKEVDISLMSKELLAYEIIYGLMEVEDDSSR